MNCVIQKPASLLCFIFILASLQGISQDELKVISVETANTEILLLVENQKVLFRHYGKRIKNQTGLSDQLVLKQRRSGPGDLPMLDEMYPTYGSGNTSEAALVVQHADGNLTTDLIYQSHTVTEVDAKTTLTTIQLRDRHYPLFVNVYFKAYFDEDVIEQWTSISHEEKEPIVLRKAHSGFISLGNTPHYLTYFYGSHNREMQLAEVPLTRGIKEITTKRGVRTSQTMNPNIIISKDGVSKEYIGDCYGLSLAWSGNFQFSLEVDDGLNLRASGGINPFLSDYHLAPDQSFVTPKLVMTYSAEGKNRLSNNYHRWVRKYNLRHGQDLRPVLLNNWTGTKMKFNEGTIKEMISDAAELGAELFVLDDGWFGNEYPRNNSRAGLGDWEVNIKKLPNGIKGLVKAAKTNNIDFGIWVEPEMVNPKSNLAENHPEWIVKSPNREPILWRHQLILDLTNPEVQDFVFGVVDKLLTNHPGIKYIKWDANRHVENLGSAHLSPDKQSHFFIDYINSLYDIYERLAKKYPDVLFQVCSSGGGRLDFGSLKYHDEYWPSDNISAYERIAIQYGNSHFYPAFAMSTHVGSSPSDQTGRAIPIKFRCDLAMTGRMGLELVPANMSEEEKAFSAKSIALYKEDLRPIVQHGDLYRLDGPNDDNGLFSVLYANEDQSQARCFVFSTDYHLRDYLPNMKLRGLDPEANYRVTEINKDGKSYYPNSGIVSSGELLMTLGVDLRMRKVYESVILKLEKI